MASTLINLYRDKRNGKLGGVCAGIARRLEVEPWLVRVLAITGLLFASFLTLVLYIAAWLLLDDIPDNLSPSRPRSTSRPPAGARGWPRVRRWSGSKPG
ncbi:PspC domain-containing protein [Oceanimonas sp. NS1]|nr:PspC domain-containing protein [Oceanimonas sp. NS1]